MFNTKENEIEVRTLYFIQSIYNKLAKLLKKMRKPGMLQIKNLGPKYLNDFELELH